MIIFLPWHGFKASVSPAIECYLLLLFFFNFLDLIGLLERLYNNFLIILVLFEKSLYDIRVVTQKVCFYLFSDYFRSQIGDIEVAKIVVKLIFNFFWRHETNVANNRVLPKT